MATKVFIQGYPVKRADIICLDQYRFDITDNITEILLLNNSSTKDSED